METRADGNVIMHPDGMVMTRENLQDFSTVHGLEWG